MDLKGLAERYDPDSRETYLSAYADLQDPFHARALDARARELRAAVADPALRANLDAAWEQARAELGRLQGRGARGAAVFASPAHRFAEAHALAEPVPTALVLDSSPYIRPLARHLDELEAFVLVLLDGRRAAVFAVAAGRAEVASRERTRLSSRHTKGGWSQMRYQRHRQGALDRYLDEVASQAEAAMRDAGARRVVVAGPGQVKRQLVGRMPKPLADAVVAVEDAELDGAVAPRDPLVRRFVVLARAEEAEASAEALQAFKGELLKGEVALAGPFAVARAAREGRVELLLVAKDHRAGGAKCEAHQSFFEAGSACHCGSQGTEVDLLNEAVQGAARHGSRVEFVADKEGFLRGLGGAGALLRW